MGTVRVQVEATVTGPWTRPVGGGDDSESDGPGPAGPKSHFPLLKADSDSEALPTNSLPVHCHLPWRLLSAVQKSAGYHDGPQPETRRLRSA